VAPFNHANGSGHDDDFWRAQDALLGVSSDRGVQHPPDAPPVAEIERLTARVNDAVAQAAVLERRAEELKAGLQATVTVFHEQLADMENEHRQRLATIRAGARAEIERISTDARRRTTDLDVDVASAPAAQYGGSSSAA